MNYVILSLSVLVCCSVGAVLCVIRVLGKATQIYVNIRVIFGRVVRVFLCKGSH